MKRTFIVVLQVRTRTGLIYYQAAALVILGFLLSPCISAPANIDLCMAKLNPCNKNSCKPWYDPCSNEHKTRHSRSTQNIVKDQIRTVLGNLDNVILPSMGKIYGQIKHMKKPKLKLSWLKNKKFLNVLRRNDTETLRNFQRYIQMYAATIYRLSLIDINTNDPDFDGGKRCSTFNSVLLELKRLLCELADTIESREQKVPGFIDDEKDMKITFPATADATKGSVYDYGVLKRLKQFLKQSSRILFSSGSARSRRRKVLKKKTESKLKSKNSKKLAARRQRQ